MQRVEGRALRCALDERPTARCPCLAPPLLPGHPMQAARRLSLWQEAAAVAAAPMASGGGGGDAQQGRLLGMIVDQDTATGLLLTGVGNVDLRKKGNFLIVDDSEQDGLCDTATPAVAVAAPPRVTNRTLQGTLRRPAPQARRSRKLRRRSRWEGMGGGGQGMGMRKAHDPDLPFRALRSGRRLRFSCLRCRPPLTQPPTPTHPHTHTPPPKNRWAQEFTSREDIAVLLINQYVAGTIRHLLDAYTKPVRRPRPRHWARPRRGGDARGQPPPDRRRCPRSWRSPLRTTPTTPARRAH